MFTLCSWNRRSFVTVCFDGFEILFDPTGSNGRSSLASRITAAFPLIGQTYSFKECPGPGCDLTFDPVLLVRTGGSVHPGDLKRSHSLSRRHRACVPIDPDVRHAPTLARLSPCLLALFPPSRAFLLIEAVRSVAQLLKRPRDMFHGIIDKICLSFCVFFLGGGGGRAAKARWFAQTEGLNWLQT